METRDEGAVRGTITEHLSDYVIHYSPVHVLICPLKHRPKYMILYWALSHLQVIRWICTNILKRFVVWCDDREIGNFHQLFQYKTEEGHYCSRLQVFHKKGRIYHCMETCIFPRYHCFCNILSTIPVFKTNFVTKVSFFYVFL